MGTKFIRYPFLAILAAPLSLTFSLSPSLFSFTFPPFAMADSQALPHPAPKLTRREIKRPARYRVDFLDEEETKKELQDAQHAKRSKKKDAPYDDAGENGGVVEKPGFIKTEQGPHPRAASSRTVLTGCIKGAAGRRERVGDGALGPRAPLGEGPGARQS